MCHALPVSVVAEKITFTPCMYASRFNPRILFVTRCFDGVAGSEGQVRTSCLWHLFWNYCWCVQVMDNLWNSCQGFVVVNVGVVVNGSVVVNGV